MKIGKTSIVLGAALIGIAGCFTVSETEYPKSVMPVSGGTNATLAVRGFSAVVTDYVMVDGWSTVYTSGGCGRHWCSPGGYQVVRTTTSVPQARATGAYLEQAKSRFETVGFITMAGSPDYVVEGTFSGPFAESDARMWRFLYNLCTIFTSDRAPYSWKGTVKVYDNRTGRLVFRREYEQAHEVTVFSPIPLFGISHCERTGYGYAQAWCLTALTDRMSADAASFLVAQGDTAK